MNVTGTEITIVGGFVVTVVSVLYPLFNSLKTIASSHLSLHAKIDAMAKDVINHKAQIETAARDILELKTAISTMATGSQLQVNQKSQSVPTQQSQEINQAAGGHSIPLTPPKLP